MIARAILLAVLGAACTERAPDDVCNVGTRSADGTCYVVVPARADAAPAPSDAEYSSDARPDAGAPDADGLRPDAPSECPIASCSPEPCEVTCSPFPCCCAPGTIYRTCFPLN